MKVRRENLWSKWRKKGKKKKITEKKPTRKKNLKTEKLHEKKGQENEEDKKQINAIWGKTQKKRKGKGKLENNLNNLNKHFLIEIVFWENKFR